MTDTARDATDSEDEQEVEENQDDDGRHHGSSKTIQWTSEEQSSVMAFYGLQSLFPQTWADTRDDITHPFPSSASLIKQPSVAIAAKTTLASAVVHAEQEAALDAVDPLGIKDLKNRNMKRRRSSLLQQHQGASQNSDSYTYSLSISSKHFNAPYFLRHVHKNTSYRDLEQGAQRLKVAIDHRQDVIKNLVKTHFAQFVGAKSTIDDFYEQMRKKSLTASEEYGISPFEKTISSVHSTAASLYTPLLERRAKAEKIRMTLGILNQWRFFFNLPSVVRQHIQAEKYDALVRDYQKGKYMLRKSFGIASQNQSRKRAADKDKDALLPQHYKSVFEKVWDEVERLVDECRANLFVMLKDVHSSLDVRLRVAGYLSDLDAKEEPVLALLDSLHTWILKDLMTAYAAHHKAVESLDYTQAVPLSLRHISKLLQNEYECVATRVDVRIWKLSVMLVKNMTKILGRLPDFWRVGKVWCESSKTDVKNSAYGSGGSGGASGGGGKRRLDAKRVDVCQKRIVEVLDLFNRLLSGAFFLEEDFALLRLHSTENVSSNVKMDDSPSSPAAKTVTAAAGPNIVPLPHRAALFLHTHPLISVHYSLVTLHTLHTRCSSLPNALSLPSPAFIRGTYNLTNQLTQVICANLIEVSRGWWRYEHDMWVDSSAIAVWGRMSRAVLTGLSRIVGMSEGYGEGGDVRKEAQVRRAEENVVDAVEESVVGILDGLCFLAMEWEPNERQLNGNTEVPEWSETGASPSTPDFVSGISEKVEVLGLHQARYVNISDKSSRLLHILTVLTFFHSHTLSTLSTHFHALFTAALSSFPAVPSLFSLLLNTLVQRFAEPLHHAIHAGLLNAGADYENMQRVGGVRAWAGRCVMGVVQVVAGLEGVRVVEADASLYSSDDPADHKDEAKSTSLLSLILSRILDTVSLLLFNTVAHVLPLSASAHLQLVIELEYLQTTFDNYLTPEAHKMFDIIYGMLEDGVAGKSEERETGNEKERIEEARMYLEDMRDGTWGVVRCFGVGIESEQNDPTPGEGNDKD
ncbi:hypothetical protein HDU85_000399 [Gaertneriomyces sp. JEL0708]|nr:hypothetical protein HDU85_000399 [Gaertneriomyces sp. JEL0708]